MICCYRAAAGAAASTPLLAAGGGKDAGRTNAVKHCSWLQTLDAQSYRKPALSWQQKSVPLRLIIVHGKMDGSRLFCSSAHESSFKAGSIGRAVVPVPRSDVSR